MAWIYTAAGGCLGILQAMREKQAAFLNGDRYVTFHQITEGQAAQLEEDSRLSDVGSLINDGYVKLGNSGLTLFLRVAGITQEVITVNNEGFKNGVQIIVNDEMYDELTGRNRYLEVYPALKPDAGHEQFEEWLDGWCRVRVLFIVLIGILNIINTVYSSIHTRISEIGMQRAVGMSAGSLYKTFLWEGAYYGVAASVAGGAAGISIAACLLAAAVPLRSIAKMDIVSAIEAAE